MKPFIKEKILLRFFLVLVCLRLEEVAPLRIFHQAVPTPKIDFVLEIVTKKSTVPDDLVSVDDVFLLSETKPSFFENLQRNFCLLYTSPSPRDKRQSRMPSSA